MKLDSTWGTNIELQHIARDLIPFANSMHTLLRLGITGVTHLNQSYELCTQVRDAVYSEFSLESDYE